MMDGKTMLAYESVNHIFFPSTAGYSLPAYKVFQRNRMITENSSGFMKLLRS